MDEYRRTARFVAYCESIFTILQFLAEVWSIGAGNPPASPGVTWTVLGVRSISVPLALWAAIKLKNGTDPGRQVTDALDLCKTWQLADLMIIVVDTLLQAYSGWFISWTPFVLFIRQMGFWLVHQFVMELQTDLHRNPMRRPPAA